MSVFDLSKPDAEAIRSPMGGGWIIPLTPAGTQALLEFYGEEAEALDPLGGRCGYLVEPYQSGDLAEHLRSCDCAWRVG